jgi:hypothetical protein
MLEYIATIGVIVVVLGVIFGYRVLIALAVKKEHE